jgi:hypothetical protein
VDLILTLLDQVLDLLVGECKDWVILQEGVVDAVHLVNEVFDQLFRLFRGSLPENGVYGLIFVLQY